MFRNRFWIRPVTMARHGIVERQAAQGFPTHLHSPHRSSARQDREGKHRDENQAKNAYRCQRTSLVVRVAHAA